MERNFLKIVLENLTEILFTVRLGWVRDILFTVRESLWGKQSELTFYLNIYILQRYLIFSICENIRPSTRTYEKSNPKSRTFLVCLSPTV